jgi:hypothetical protein
MDLNRRCSRLGRICATVAALAGVISVPARAEPGEPAHAQAQQERSSLLSRSWRAVPAPSQGSSTGAPRLLLEPGAASGARASLRLPLDANSTLSLRLRRQQMSVALRVQF